MMKSIRLLLVGIVLLGALLRFYGLGNVPVSLNWDEVAIGYNAYSILQTGKDEFAETLPLSFRSFGDYKQPGYIYLTVPAVAVFDLTPFAVRFPSALFGTLTILAVFFLVYELFYKEKRREVLTLLSAGLFALSPWSIQFSRFASEANVALFFTLAGAWLLLFGIRKKQVVLLTLAIISLVMSMYTYHSQKLFTPFLLGVLVLYHYKFFLSRKELSMGLLTLFVLLNSFWILDARATERGRSVLFTSEQTPLLKQPMQLLIEDRERGDEVGALLHNRRLVYLQTYLQNYLVHFDPNFLFLKGDNARHHAPYHGVVYPVLLPFIILGILRLWEKYRRQAWLLTAWLLAAPAVAALAINAPNAIRSMMFLPLWQLFAAVGILYTVTLVKKPLFRNFVIGIIAFFYIVNAFYYVHMYFFHTNTEFAKYWQYGYQEAIAYVQSEAGNTPVVFTQDIEQAQSFYLFHAKVDPKVYLKEGGSKRMEEKCFRIDNAYFGNCLSEVTQGFIVASKDLPDGIQASRVKDIAYPDGETAVSIYQRK